MRTLPTVQTAIAAATGIAFCLPGAAQFQLAQPLPSAIGGQVQLQAQAATPGALVFAGLSFALQQPPAPSPFGAVWLGAPIASLPLGIANAQGFASGAFALPADPIYVGARLYAQALDFGNPALSSPWAVWVGPPDSLDSPNQQVTAQFGWSVAVADFVGGPDLDIAVGAPGESVGAVAGAGRVYVFEGPTWANVTSLTAPLPEFGGSFGRALVACDFDGDGLTDLAVGAPGHDAAVIGPDAGGVFLFSYPVVGVLPPLTLGATIPQTFEGLGASLASADLDSNGTEEILAGAPHPGGAGQGPRRVVVFDSNGAQAVLPDPGGLNASFAERIAVGDFQGDGIPDVAVSDPAYNGAAIAEGRVYVFANGLGPVQVIANPAPAFAARFGSGLAAGDWTGDGTDDLLIGEQGQNRALSFPGPMLNGPAQLPTSRAGDTEGGRSIALADLNGDGILDAVAAATSCTGGAVCGSLSVWFGPTAAVRGYMTHQGLAQVQAPGWSLATGDLDGDGDEEVVAGAPSSNPAAVPGAGRVLIFR